MHAILSGPVPSRALRIASKLAPTLLFGPWLAFAQSPPLIPDAEALANPTPQRLAAIHTAAQRSGWTPQIAPIRAAALRAYESEKTVAAEQWYYVGRWAALFAQTEAEFVPKWIEAVNAAKVGHAGMSVPPVVHLRPLGAELLPELQLWLLGNAAFAEEFFSLLAPVDYVPEVFHILTALHHGNPNTFRSYASLALAIALVYDLPPPPVWPHGQVTPRALPRKFASAATAFAWWVKQDQQGRTFHKLARLGAGELKFVVDTVTPLAELEWVQGISDYPLNQLERAYTMVRYRQERIAGNVPIWPGHTYKLIDILSTGGICADQAYFATQLGKSRGVPTLLIYGAGNDGRHAWFGFLDGNQKWQLDAGRYAAQKFVTGFARDPQTWREFSDHELQFLSERFRELPSFRQSRVHALFAAEYLAAGNHSAASTAARKAVNYERRNQPAWETLIAAARAAGREPKTIENLLREAALAFQRYPDLEAAFVNRVAESLRARGQTSEADAEVRNIALKNRRARGDLSVQQARDIVMRAVASQQVPQQIAAYNQVVDSYGRGAGVAFFDQVVIAFAEHLVQLKQRPEALKAIERARRVMRVEPGSQLEADFAQLVRLVKAAK